MYNSVTHHLYITLCVYYPNRNLLITMNLNPFTLYYPSPLLPLVITLPLAVSLFFSFVHLLLSVLYPTHKWNHIALDFLCSSLFIQLISITWQRGAQ